MTKNEVVIRKYTADEGCVFDWVDPHYHTNEEGDEVRDHLYAKTLFLGKNDSIENYVEVYAPTEEEAANEDTK